MYKLIEIENGFENMGLTCRQWIIGGCFVLAAACARFEASRPEAPQAPTEALPYTWSSFFNEGCGAGMGVHILGENTGMLEYECPGGEIKSQQLRRQSGRGDTRFWIAEPLVDADLYDLSNSKCRATMVALGLENATIQYRCALVMLTVGYTVAENAVSENAIRFSLLPRRALVAYSDGTQEFEVDNDTFVPTGPFEPFQTAPAPSRSF